MFRTNALHVAFGTDRAGRTREMCGNCSDWLEDEYFAVQADLASGDRVELHICEPCLELLQKIAQEDSIPLVELEPESCAVEPTDDPR